MDISLNLLFRVSETAAEPIVFKWLSGRDAGAAVITRDAFLALPREDQHLLYALTTNAVIQAAGEDTRLASPVYCAGGCASMLFAADALAPATIHLSDCLRSTSYLWDTEKQRMCGDALLAVHCKKASCLLAVRTYFHDESRKMRAANPGAIARRYCAVCHACDTVAVPFKRCVRCRITSYCSPECQKKDWKSHKTACVPRV